MPDLIANILILHFNSLEVIQFGIDNGDVKNVLEQLSLRRAKLDLVRNIRITTVNVFARRVKGKFKLPLHPSIFPSLKHLTFGLTKYSGNYKANQHFFEFSGLHDIIFRPSGGYYAGLKVDRKLLRVSAGMSKGKFRYHFINVPLCEDYVEGQWLLERKSCSDTSLDYWNG